MDKQISEQRPQLYMLLLSEVRNETTRPMTSFTKLQKYALSRSKLQDSHGPEQVTYDELWCSSTNTGSS